MKLLLLFALATLCFGSIQGCGQSAAAPTAAAPVQNNTGAPASADPSADQMRQRLTQKIDAKGK